MSNPGFINIVSWNINSIRARLEHLSALVREASPDIILLQETKVHDDKFPKEFIEDLGYNLLIHGEKSYNGVAVLSRGPIEDITKYLPGDTDDIQSRYAECVTTIKGRPIRVASVYVPNGKAIKSVNFLYKLKFFERLKSHFEEIVKYDEIFLAGGDYNVAPENRDVYSPQELEGQLGFHIEERKRFRAILSSGVYDSYRVAHPTNQAYSWWDYRASGWLQNKGMRIDQILISPQACDLMAEAGIHTNFRGKEKASDHVPIYCKLRAC